MSVDELIRAAIAEAKPSSSGWARVNCPICPTSHGKPDKRRSLGVKLETGFYSCFRCGARDVLDGGTERDPFATGAAKPDPDRPALPPEFASLEGSLVYPFDFSSANSVASNIRSEHRPAWDYLRKRRVRRELIRECNIGACTTGKYAGRVIVPITRTKPVRPGHTWDPVRHVWEHDTGKPALKSPQPVSYLQLPTGWVGRTWGPSSLPYIYPPGRWREGVFFNDAAALHPSRTDQLPKLWRVYSGVGSALSHEHMPVVLVEGVFDALALWPWAAAFLGKPTQSHIDAIVNWKRPVCLVLDGDAHEEGWALATHLRLLGVPAGSVRLPPRKDPDEVPQDWLYNEIAEAMRPAL